MTLFQIETMNSPGEPWEPVDDPLFATAEAAILMIDVQHMACKFAAVGVRDLDDPLGPFVWMDSRRPGPAKPPRRPMEAEDWK